MPSPTPDQIFWDYEAMKVFYGMLTIGISLPFIGAAILLKAWYEDRKEPESHITLLFKEKP